VAGLDEDATAPAVAAAVPSLNTDGRTERFIPVPGFMGQTGPAVTPRNVLIASVAGTPGLVPAGFP